MNTEHQLLDEIDRRAATAVAELDRAVETVRVPEFDAPPARSGHGRWPLLAAAVVAVVALVAGGVLLAQPDQRDATVADDTTVTDDGLTLLALPDPQAAGFEIESTFEDFASEGEIPIPDATVLGRSGPSPWDVTVVDYAYEFPAGAPVAADGEPVDIGAEEARYGPGNSVSWREGDNVRYLISEQLTRTELVDLAAGAVRDGLPSGSPLPGFEVLHSGSFVDVAPVSLSIGAGPGISGLQYRKTGIQDGTVPFLIVTSRAGSEAMLRASAAQAPEVEHRVVRGHDAIVTTFTDPVGETDVNVAWLEDDDTLIRVGLNPFGDVTPERLDAFVAMLDSLVVIDHDDFVDLVLREGRTDPSTGMEVPAGTVAQSLFADGDLQLAATLIEEVDGSYSFQIADRDTDGGVSSTFTRSAVPDIETPFALAHHLGSGRIAIAGMIGPHPRGSEYPRLSLRDASGREVTGPDGSGPGSASRGNADEDRPYEYLIFFDVVPVDLLETGLELVSTTTDGGEITLDLPRQP